MCAFVRERKRILEEESVYGMQSHILHPLITVQHHNTHIIGTRPTASPIGNRWTCTTGPSSLVSFLVSNLSIKSTAKKRRRKEEISCDSWKDKFVTGTKECIAPCPRASWQTSRKRVFFFLFKTMEPVPGSYAHTSTS